MCTGKKKAVFVLGLLLCILCLFGCVRTYDTPQALIQRLRRELPLAQTEEIQYAGMTAKDNLALLWFVTGNEDQVHTYFPVECRIRGEANVQFIRSFHIVMEDRCSDVGILQWRRAYSFCINNPRCKTVRITDESGTYDEVIEKDSYPYVFMTKGLPTEYLFLDAEGNEIVS